MVPSEFISPPETEVRDGEKSRTKKLSSEDFVLEDLHNAARINKKPRKSLTSAVGLGNNWTDRLTALALVGLLLVAIGMQVAFIKQRLDRSKLGHYGEAQQLKDFEPLMVNRQSSDKQERVPVTPHLEWAFQALKSTTGHGLLHAAADEQWASARERFLKAVSTASGNLLSGDNQEDTHVALRKVMAMDLACLENAAVEAQSAIDATIGTHDAAVAEKYQKKIDARRRQVEAALLWEGAVQQGLLGSDEAIQQSILRVLAAVRGRATASEHFSMALMHAQQQDPENESVRRHFGEANAVYEAAASLAVAGQIATTSPLFMAEVANWLDIIFISI